jgi:glycosyltransferase involved in cell wall biosynthesis
VGRITRQKGIIHLVNALKHLKNNIQVVLCAGAPDTEEIAREMRQRVDEARHQTKNEIIWIRKMLPKEEVITLYSHASLFVCPSVYEPFGIINLEAMACETPVVASAVGGIPEIVIPRETGLLVPVNMNREDNHQPEDPEKFSLDLAGAVNQLMSSRKGLKEMGKKSRKRVEKYFSWNSIAHQTLDFYRDIILKRNKTRVK